MLNKYTFKRKYGQNFLTDNKLSEFIVEKANISNKNVIEIGPGKGALTKFIILKAKKVLAYEIDITLKPFLVFGSRFDVHIIYDDFLKRNLEKDFYDYFCEEEVVVMGNLPYYIVSPVLWKILFLPRVKTFTIMLQKEVALRILSSFKCKNYNALSVICQSLCFVHKIKVVKNTRFSPKPKVDGMVLKFDKIPFNTEEKDFMINKFYKFVKIAFYQKRKKLINNLNHCFGVPKIQLLKFFTEYQISPHIRAEQINIQQFKKISLLFFNFFNL
ncbi:16S rRNA (adenine(1518)-N(6)/adenine(1519)-N(6))-dimethyltransferase RsmA [Candidatus Phytoplasma melaleucae]|uniref:Ribosomal RNA small subunit methyltransferase A n=1 Tax=Candidatus Phytoplasma melaleucae TaxID=2982630 RepID=A0ABT9DD17_9MOLU|nr:16S rRNA (adenine(1518)-N(6)/adenine(1519)-N(6))-dimethyltransferase RsmA ['Melaleuca sp.' phytoplasma]MDO8167984.1 16S rRNA (adenine(1518)-N(6)/adenine(1519)-N(6))-dimethyltransferase RsmA ['Melaleuca sp.' phytoplasma]